MATLQEEELQIYSQNIQKTFMKLKKNYFLCIIYACLRI